MYEPINNIIKLHTYTGLIVLTLLSPCMSFSADNDTAENKSNGALNINSDELHIEADYMKFDIASSSSTYRGNVNIVQGTIKLSGDNVTITRKNNQVSQIQVDGNPARYMQDEQTDNKVHAASQHMEYNAKTRLLVLTVDASLEQSNHTVESQRIVYDTQNKVILAGKSSNAGPTGDRVNIILTPEKDAP